MNSKLLSYRYKSIGKQTGGGSFEYFPNGVGKLPIPEIDSDKQNPFVDLVNQMFEVQKKYHSKNTDHEKKIYKNQIDVIDNQIDSLVYELYGLNENDIKVIEDSLK